MPSYVYTLDAVRSRLRWKRSVLLFMPYTAELVNVTNKNFKSVSKRFKDAINARCNRNGR